MHRFSFAALVAVLALAAAAVGITACGGSSTPKISQDVQSKPGDGAASDSLFMEANLSKALTKFTDKFGTGNISLFKLEPNSIKATSSSGIEIIGKSGETSGIKSPVTIPDSGAGFSPSDIDASAPEKIVSSLKSKGVTLANTNYFVVSAALSAATGGSGTPGWLIYTAKGNFQADPDGSNAKPLGSSSIPSITTPKGTTVPDTGAIETQAKKAAQAAESQATAAAGAAQSIADCVAAAGTDADKIKKCAGQ